MKDRDIHTCRTNDFDYSKNLDKVNKKNTQSGSSSLEINKKADFKNSDLSNLYCKFNTTKINDLSKFIENLEEFTQVAIKNDSESDHRKKDTPFKKCILGDSKQDKVSQTTITAEKLDPSIDPEATNGSLNKYDVESGCLKINNAFQLESNLQNRKYTSSLDVNAHFQTGCSVHSDSIDSIIHSKKFDSSNNIDQNKNIIGNQSTCHKNTEGFTKLTQESSILTSLISKIDIFQINSSSKNNTKKVLEKRDCDVNGGNTESTQPVDIMSQEYLQNIQNTDLIKSVSMNDKNKKSSEPVHIMSQECSPDLEKTYDFGSAFKHSQQLEKDTVQYIIDLSSLSPIIIHIERSYPSKVEIRSVIGEKCYVYPRGLLFDDYYVLRSTLYRYFYEILGVKTRDKGFLGFVSNSLQSAFTFPNRLPQAEDQNNTEFNFYEFYRCKYHQKFIKCKNNLIYTSLTSEKCYQIAIASYFIKKIKTNLNENVLIITEDLETQKSLLELQQFLDKPNFFEENVVKHSSNDLSHPICELITSEIDYYIKISDLYNDTDSYTKLTFLSKTNNQLSDLTYYHKLIVINCQTMILYMLEACKADLDILERIYPVIKARADHFFVSVEESFYEDKHILGKNSNHRAFKINHINNNAPITDLEGSKNYQINTQTHSFVDKSSHSDHAYSKSYKTNSQKFYESSDKMSQTDIDTSKTNTLATQKLSGTVGLRQNCDGVDAFKKFGSSLENHSNQSFYEKRSYDRDLDEFKRTIESRKFDDQNFHATADGTKYDTCTLKPANASPQDLEYSLNDNRFSYQMCSSSDSNGASYHEINNLHQNLLTRLCEKNTGMPLSTSCYLRELLLIMKFYMKSRDDSNQRKNKKIKSLGIREGATYSVIRTFDKLDLTTLYCYISAYDIFMDKHNQLIQYNKEYSIIGQRKSLFSPIQRLSQYPLFFNRIMKNNNDSSFNMIIQRYVDQFKKVLQSIDKEKQIRTNKKLCEKILKRIKNCPRTLNDLKYFESHLDLSKMTLFLLDDTLIVTKREYLETTLIDEKSGCYKFITSGKIFEWDFIQLNDELYAIVPRNEHNHRYLLEKLKIDFITIHKVIGQKAFYKTFSDLSFEICQRNNGRELIHLLKKDNINFFHLKNNRPPRDNGQPQQSGDDDSVEISSLLNHNELDISRNKFNYNEILEPGETRTCNPQTKFNSSENRLDFDILQQFAQMQTHHSQNHANNFHETSGDSSGDLKIQQGSTNRISDYIFRSSDQDFEDLTHSSQFNIDEILSSLEKIYKYVIYMSKNGNKIYRRIVTVPKANETTKDNTQYIETSPYLKKYQRNYIYPVQINKKQHFVDVKKNQNSNNFVQNSDSLEAIFEKIFIDVEDNPFDSGTVNHRNATSISSSNDYCENTLQTKNFHGTTAHSENKDFPQADYEEMSTQDIDKNTTPISIHSNDSTNPISEKDFHIESEISAEKSLQRTADFQDINNIPSTPEMHSFITSIVEHIKEETGKTIGSFSLNLILSNKISNLRYHGYLCELPNQNIKVLCKKIESFFTNKTKYITKTSDLEKFCLKNAKIACGKIVLIDHMYNLEIKPGSEIVSDSQHVVMAFYESVLESMDSKDFKTLEVDLNDIKDIEYFRKYFDKDSNFFVILKHWTRMYSISPEIDFIKPLIRLFDSLALSNVKKFWKICITAKN